MTKSVLQICPSCAVNNGATWKNPRNTAPLFLTVCGCCGEVKPCTHIQFWQGIKSDSDLKAPNEVKQIKKKAPNKVKANTDINTSLLGDGQEQE